MADVQKKKGKRGKNPWTPEETKKFLEGVSKHGPGKWRKILDDSNFGETLVNRTQENLKDKWRNLAKCSKPPEDLHKIIEHNADGYYDKPAPNGKIRQSKYKPCKGYRGRSEATRGEELRFVHDWPDASAPALAASGKQCFKCSHWQSQDTEKVLAEAATRQSKRCRTDSLPADQQNLIGAQLQCAAFMRGISINRDQTTQAGQNQRSSKQVIGRTALEDIYQHTGFAGTAEDNLSSVQLQSNFAFANVYKIDEQDEDVEAAVALLSLEEQFMRYFADLEDDGGVLNVGEQEGRSDMFKLDFLDRCFLQNGMICDC